MLKITNRRIIINKNKSGFTLIELLAVIVILAIIALIATPIVMNIISDAKISANERSAENYIKQINNKTASLYANPETRLDNGIYYIMSNGNLCFGTISDEECTGENQRTIPIEMSGTKPTSGTIAIENSKVVPSVMLEDGIYTTVITISGNTLNLGTNGKTKKLWVYIDINSNDEIDIGDMISIGTERFYIISNDGINIRALSQYNLNVGSNPYGGLETGLQNKNSKGYSFVEGAEMYGNVAFDNDSNIYDESDIKEIVNEYKIKLNNDYDAKIIQTSLISKDDLINIFGCSVENNKCPEEMPFIYSTTYWTDTPYNTTSVWYVILNNIFGFNGYKSPKAFGVRPVVTILSSEI